MKQRNVVTQKIVSVLLLVALLLTLATPAFAEGGPGTLPKGDKVVPLSVLMDEWKNAPPALGGNGGFDPDIQFSVREIQELHERILLAEKYYATKHIFPNYLGGNSLSVGYYPEPNDDAHVNYCGPAATLVALSARQYTPASLLETVATEEGIHESTVCSPGVCMGRVRDTLNARLPGSPYLLGAAQSASQLYSWIVSDIDSGYVLVTGTLTDSMPGWNQWHAKHIVAVNGYWEGSPDNIVVKYIETASERAGYYGPYHQSAHMNAFWGFVVDNNAQSW